MKTPGLVVLLLLCVNPVRAERITEFVSFDLTASAVGFSTGNGAKAMQINALNPFDSSLGQLDSVRLSILLGNIVITGSGGKNGFQIPGLAGGFVAIPYTIAPTLKIGMGGLTDFFEISPSMDSLFSMAATGVRGGILPKTGALGLDFTIDELTEKSSRWPLTYSTKSGVPTSIPFYSGKRSDFLDTEIISDLLLFSLELDFISTALAPERSAITLDANLKGTMQVRYDYTPAADPVSPVPIPAAAWLFGTALVGLFGFNKHRKAA